MRIYLAGIASHQSICGKNPPKYFLESFYYFKDWEKTLLETSDILLDSGAFTFMQSSKKKTNWDEYIERYAQFIVSNNIDKFFELDIDSIVGYAEVLRLRDKLQRLTGKQPIPVWHKPRGISEYKRHCDEFPYIAIGGYVIKEFRPSDFSALPAMLNYAHLHNTKVHGLGFTATTRLKEYHFDSVDSTTWTVGGRFADLCYFDGHTMRRWSSVRNGMKMTNSEGVCEKNYNEWLKFQAYAEHHL